VVAGFPFGEYDVVVVYDAPDDMTAASVAMAVSAAGEVRSGKTTRLLSGQEWLESLRKRRIVTSRKRASPTTADSDERNSSSSSGPAGDS
jgi:GYD domain